MGKVYIILPGDVRFVIISFIWRSIKIVFAVMMYVSKT